MTVKLTLRQLQQQLPELLDRASDSREPVVVQRQGKDDVVIVSARQWRRLATGKRLDALGPAFRLSPTKQKRVEELLAAKGELRLTKDERKELNSLLRECDELLLKRASALDRMQ